VFFAFRVLDPDPKKATALIESVRIYPFANRKNSKPTKLIRPEGRAWTQVPPRGFGYWQILNDIVQREPVQERDRVMMALLRPVGIEKSKPFQPDERRKKTLTDGAVVGELMAQGCFLSSARRRPCCLLLLLIGASPFDCLGRIVESPRQTTSDWSGHMASPGLQSMCEVLLKRHLYANALGVNDHVDKAEARCEVLEILRRGHHDSVRAAAVREGNRDLFGHSAYRFGRRSVL
jgi:hypothetical protein